MEKPRILGALRTIAKWEDLIASLPHHAEGPDGLGRIWEHEDPPRNAGQDPIIKQGWRLNVQRGVEFGIPEDISEMLEIPASESPTGNSYTLIRIDRTAVHLHGVKIEDGRVVGDVHICARVFWPKGADARPDDGKTKAWRNYLLYVDIYPPREEVVSRALEVYPEGSQRSEIVQLGGTDDLDGTPVTVWATRSANWSPARRGNPSTGSDQLLFFVPLT